MRYGSLFSGVGGIDLGLERAGLTCAWQIENEPYARRVLEKHWPDVPKYGDIKELDPHGLERVDLVAGGFPCQSVSFAGKGKAQDDERWLWPEFERVLRVLRPRYALMENVPGLLSRGLGILLGDLSSLGYDAEWESVSAAAFGAPHLRRRVFLVAYSKCVRRRDNISPSVFQGEHLAESAQWISSKDERSIDIGGCSYPRIPAHLRVDDGFPCGMERMRGLGNAVVPRVAQWLGELILEHDGSVA